MVSEQHDHITVDELPGLTRNAPVAIKRTEHGAAIGLLPGVVPDYLQGALAAAISEAVDAGWLSLTHTG